MTVFEFLIVFFVIVVALCGAAIGVTWDWPRMAVIGLAAAFGGASILVMEVGR